MKRLTHLAAAAALCLTSALSAQADGGITDQRYYGGKYGAGHGAAVLNTCPREYREMYRGDLYCRKPEYRVVAPRSRACPKDIWGMYRGDLYCFGKN